MTSEPPAPVSPPPLDPYDEPLDVRSYLWAIWRNGWVIGLSAVLGAAIGLALTRFVPPIYQATARLNLSQSGAVPPDLQARYRALLDNPVVAQHVVATLRLDRPPLKLTPAQLQHRLSSRVGSAASIILIDARLPDPAIATRVVVEAAKRLAELAREQDSAATASSLAAIKLEQAEAQQLVVLARDALSRYRQEPRNVAIARRGARDTRGERRSLPELEEDLESERAELRASTARLASEPPALTLKDADVGTPTALANPLYVALSEHIVHSRARIAGIEARIQYIKRFQGKVPRLEELAAFEVGLANLEAELGRAQRFHEQLGEVSFQLRRDSILPRFSLKYVEEPTPPATMVFPRRLNFMAAGGVTCFLLSLLGVLLRQWRQSCPLDQVTPEIRNNGPS